MIEIWKDIEGYENHYQVSNLNNYRSIKKGKIRNLKLGNTNGRPTLNLSKDGVVEKVYFNKKYRSKNENYTKGDKIKNMKFISYTDRIGGKFEIAIFECPICRKHYKTTFITVFNGTKSCGCIRKSKRKITPEKVLKILKINPFIKTNELTKIFNISKSWALKNKTLAFKLM